MFKKVSERVYTRRKITLWTAICYGLTDFGSGGVSAVISTWMLFFYTTYCNLSATEGALIVAVGNIATAIVSLLMGGLTDNFYTHPLGQKYGRRHFFLLFGSPLLLAFGAMWIGGLNFWYYLFTYVAFYALQTALAIPYETLPNEMTTDFKQRTFLSTTRMVFSALANFFAAFVPGQLFRIFGQKSAMSLTINGFFFGIILAGGMLLTALNTWELPLSDVQARHTEEDLKATKNKNIWKTLLADIKGYLSTFRIKSFRKHLIIYLCSFTGYDLCNVVFAYYIIYVIGKSATFSANLLSLSAFGVLATIAGGFLIVKIGPRKLYTIAYVSIIAMYISFAAIAYLKPNHIVVMLFVVTFVYLMGRALGNFAPWNLFPLIPDLDELVVGKNRAGTFASVMTFLRNSTAGLATAAAGIYLDHNNFARSSATQSPEAQHAIVNVILFGSGTLVLIAFITALTFKLNQHTHKIIIDEIQRLRDGGSKADATEETKRITKELTGFDYKDVWQR